MSLNRSLIELANSISQDAAVLDDYCKANSLPAPSLDANGGSLNHIADPAAAKAQERLISDTHELHVLAMGSFSGLRALQNQPDIDLMTFSFLTRYEIVKKVPSEGDISFEDLAKQCDVPPAFMKRLLRYAMTNFVLSEKREGYVSHTAMSLLLKEHPFLHTVSEIGTEERFPGSARAVDAIVAHPECDEPSKSGWGLANNATRSMFEELAAVYPDRAARFGKAMDAYASMLKTDVLTDNYDWAALGTAKVVDVGGGKGPVSIDLARKFPNLSFVVQDLQDIVQQGRSQLPEDVKDKVEFMEADFFKPQPIHGADVYFLRAVTHNWPDKYCVRILQSLVPAMKKGARVIVHDPYLVDLQKISRWNGRQALAATLHMMVYFNALDRNEAEWENLFCQADRRFRVVSLKKPEDIRTGGTGSGMCILEAVWEG